MSTRARWILILLLGSCATAAVMVARHQSRAEIDQFTVVHQAPPGWIDLKAVRPTVFLYRNPATRARIRCAIQIVAAGYDVTPQLDGQRLAQQFVESTTRDMKGWKVEALPAVESDKIRFDLVRRWSANKAVVTAFATRRNTTAVVDLSADGLRALETVERHLAEFVELLRTIEWRPLKP